MMHDEVKKLRGEGPENGSPPQQRCSFCVSSGKNSLGAYGTGTASVRDRAVVPPGVCPIAM